MKYTYEQIVRNIKLYYISNGEIDDINISKILDRFKSIFNYSKIYRCDLAKGESVFYYMKNENECLSIVSENYGWTVLNKHYFYNLIDSLDIDIIDSREDLYKIVRYYMKDIIGDEYVDIESTDWDNKTTREVSQQEFEKFEYYKNVKIC